MARKKIEIKTRTTGLIILLLIMFSAVLFKLAFVQFVQGEKLQAEAESQRTREVVISAKRGTIYDCHGNTLAVSISADSVYANPSVVKKSGQAESTAAFLAEKLGMDKDKILSKITSGNAFEWIKRKADFDVAAAIKEADLPGIDLVEENQRYYPQKELAANLLGFAGIDNQGLEGLEISLDKNLRGVDGSIIGYFDVVNQEIPQTAQIYNEPTDGYDVVLTIDENIQYFAERELNKVMASELDPKSCSAIIMNPKTGEILAMATRPTYDPNNYGDYTTKDRRNPLVQDSYEPGSTFKIVTASVALEEKTASLTSRYYDPGYYAIGGHKIKCWRHYKPHGSQSFAEVMQNSCNPGFVKIGLDIENKTEGLFYKYIKAFGYGKQTGIDISGEATGIMIAETNLKPINIATISIGQGISVTPIQMVTAVSAVANGGILLEPQIVRQIKNGEGDIISDFQVKEVRRVISEETANTVCELLESVVTKGTAKRAYIEGFRVGGKTGTAQKVENGKYADGKYVASFIGIAPANDPQVVCLVLIDEPKGYLYQGGQIAAPLFNAIMTDVLNYMGTVSQISQDNAGKVWGEQEKQQIPVADVTNLSLAAANKVLSIYGFKVKSSGSGEVVTGQTPAGLTHAASASTIALSLGNNSKNNGKLTVPDLTGRHISEAAEILGAMGLSLKKIGNEGTAYEQIPVPGSLVNEGTMITVNFQIPSQDVTVLQP